MNNSSNLFENYYIQIGSTWLSDTISVFVLAPLGFITICLNFLSFCSFLRMNKKLETNLTKYFRAYTLTSFIGCLLASLYFLTSPRYFQFANSFLISFYRCKVSQYIITLNFYANSLDCLILFERNACFLDKMKQFSKINPYIVSLIVFILCNIINSPYLFYSFTRDENEYISAMNNLELKNFTYCQRNPFFLTIFGHIILILVIIARDIIVLILQICFSIASIVYFKEYLRLKRNSMMCNTISTTNENLKYITDVNETSLNRSELFNSKLTKMTIYLVSCSTILHLTLAIGYLVIVIFFSQSTLIANYFSIACILIAFFKYISNFLFFYNFYHFFREFLARIILLKFFSSIFCTQSFS
jgi:hypothetical protein